MGRSGRVLCWLLPLAAALFAFAQSLPATLDGEWRLVEQTYGRGGHNFAQGADLRLTFRRAATGLAATVALEGRSAPFPAYFGPEGPVPLTAARWTVDSDERGATAEYVVAPAAGDDTSLRVTERYRIDDDGLLRGEMSVRFERAGEVRGGFTWRRTFARGTHP